ncbi:hypothetical protein [Pseudoxanthomonas dokdonensis]|uniref:SpoVT-AbrB domain-containing protein n=1 Tax=Pseudoxanthomonas dokdonensis TaxID=344882 RepID=A0A0R0CKG6_9GAMM|nr:hypothetical protein [Pseudoxanthomonas dokdonensis]KRG69830.1 hypothetical protein ABB29_08555 [Pseudoxanthomonas dokdonensis]
MKLKITAIGNALGVVLPGEWLARLRLNAGDVLNAAISGDGIELSRFDAQLEDHLAIIEQIMREDDEVLCKLQEPPSP